MYGIWPPHREYLHTDIKQAEFRALYRIRTACCNRAQGKRCRLQQRFPRKRSRWRRRLCKRQTIPFRSQAPFHNRVNTASRNFNVVRGKVKLHFVFKQLFHFPARKQFKTEFVGKLRSVFIDGNIYNKALVFFDFSVAERNSGGGEVKPRPKFQERFR